MKKVLLAVAVVMLAMSVNAQVQFGVKAGLNVANQKYSSSGISMSPKSLIGFHVGVIADMPLNEKFSIQPGLLFSQKGAKMDQNSVTEKAIFNYLDIPINAVYKIDAGGVKVLLNAGPSIGYALGGKYKVDSESEDIEFGSEDGKYKRLDLGFGFGGGVQFGSVIASLNYNLGLANIINSPSGADYKIKNNVFSISLAYLFGGK